MQRDASAIGQPLSDASFRLEKGKDTWRLSLNIEGPHPNVEVRDSAVRVQHPDAGSQINQPVTYSIPVEAQPLDMESAKCVFSRKRSELVIEWPYKAPKASIPSEAETTASESEAESETRMTSMTSTTAQNSDTEAPSSKDVHMKRATAEVAAKAAEAPLEHGASNASEDKASSFEVTCSGSDETASNEGETDNMAQPKLLPEPPVETSAEEWKALGNAAVKAGDHKEGIRCYSAGLAVGGGDEAMLRSNRALCFCQLGRHEEGLEDAKRCVTLRPDFFKGYVRGAKALRALGRPEEALTFLKRCPKNDEAGALATELRPEAEAAEEKRIASLNGSERAKEEGNVFFRKGLFESAVAKYSEALEDCDDQESSLALAIRNNRAACYHQLSDYRSVVADTSFVLQKEPRNFKALFRRMLALEPLERYEAALEDARAVLRQDSQNQAANKMQHRLGKLVREIQRGSCA